MSVDHSNPSVQSRVAHRLKMAGEDPMWDAHAEVAKDVCSLGAGIIYGQKARIKDLERRMGEMQTTMSRVAEGWTRLQAERDAAIELLTRVQDIKEPIPPGTHVMYVAEENDFPGEASEIVAYALLFQLITCTKQVTALKDKVAMAVRGEALMPPGRQGRTLQAALDTILGEGQVTIDKRGDED